MPSYRRAPDEAVVTETTTSATLNASGVSVLGTIGSTGGGSANWSIGAPIAGKRKTIISTNNTTVANTVITSTASITFNGTNNKLSFAAAGNSMIHMIGITPTRYFILGSTGITLSSTS
jgi:hypothetical protein